MASDQLLKIPGVPGESKQEGYKEYIEIGHWSFGVDQPGKGGYNEGMTVGKARFENFCFSMATNTATPHLYIACASGKPFTEARLVVRRSSGGPPVIHFVAEFKNVIVAHYSINGSDDSPAMDSITLNFSELTFDYHVQDSVSGLTKSAGRRTANVGQGTFG